MARPTTRELYELAGILGIPRLRVHRYAAGAAGGNALTWLTRLYNTFFGDSRRGLGPKMPRLRRSELPSDAWDAIQLLTNPGGGRGGRRGGRPTTMPVPEPQPDGRGSQQPPQQPGSFTTMPPPPPAGSRTQTRMPSGAPPRPGEESEFGREVLTPQSSNVFSFSYTREPGARVGILYVTYKASGINPGSVKHGRVSRGSGTSQRQLIGKSGSTVNGSGKKNERGPMYAYLNVPPNIYSLMNSAASKGKFVWDRLRVRGTIWGTRYEYKLVQGQVTPEVGGVYVPRKATAKGFRTRSIADVGVGRRGFATSTLPQQDGFRTRSAPRRR